MEKEHSVTQYDFFRKLTKLPFIVEIWLYGSRARGDNQSRADIDLAILCPGALDSDWLKVFEIIDEADSLLKIDYLRFDTLDDSELKNNILKDKVILYKSQGKK